VSSSAHEFASTQNTLHQKDMYSLDINLMYEVLFLLFLLFIYMCLLFQISEYNKDHKVYLLNFRGILFSFMLGEANLNSKVIWYIA